MGADERVSYTVVARDRDGLESAAAEPIVVESEGYALAATVRPDGVHLEWNPRTGEGYHGARIFLRRGLGQKELAFVEGSRYVHTDVKPGGTLSLHGGVGTRRREPGADLVARGDRRSRAP